MVPENYKITEGSCSFIEDNIRGDGEAFAILTESGAERKKIGELETAMSWAVQAREVSRCSSHRLSPSLRLQLPSPRHPPAHLSLVSNELFTVLTE